MGHLAKWKADQRQWATERCHVHDTNGYLVKLDCNFLQPMSPETRSDFNGGSGGELRARKGITFPKMHALHSSSILACNVFDYWRSRRVDALGKALGSERVFENLKFEAQFPTALPGQPPNLDVALCCASGDVWGIESKFSEPFGAKKSGPAFKDKYFPAGRPVWSERGLPKSSVLALALENLHLPVLPTALASVITGRARRWPM